MGASLKIKLEDIRLNQLNYKSLTLVSKFSHMLKVKEGKELKLQDKDILVQISDVARTSEHLVITELYRQLKNEVRVCLSHR